jgi:hypothetical protein
MTTTYDDDQPNDQGSQDGSTDSGNASCEEDSVVVDQGQTNNLVAASDYEAAVQAYHDYFARKLSMAADDPIRVELLQACRDSILQQLGLLVQPVSDEAFHVFCHRSNPALVENDDDGASSTTDYTFTKEELLDASVATRLKQLRLQVREDAARVQQVQRQMLSDVVAQTQQDLSAHLSLNCSGANEEELDASFFEACRDKITDMEQQFQVLQQTLEQQEQSLPTHLADLQQLIQTVEQALRTEQQRLNRVEQALTQDDEPAPNPTAGPMPAQERLIQLMCRE